MNNIIGTICLLWIYSGASVQADVLINEIVTKSSDRLLRWDQNNQPYVGSNPSWRSEDFNDSLWKNGRTPIGYDLGSIRTDLGSTLRRVSPSLYVRKSFSVPDGKASSSSPLILTLT